MTHWSHSTGGKRSWQHSQRRFYLTGLKQRWRTRHLYVQRVKQAAERPWCGMNGNNTKHQKDWTELLSRDFRNKSNSFRATLFQSSSAGLPGPNWDSRLSNELTKCRSGQKYERMESVPSRFTASCSLCVRNSFKSRLVFEQMTTSPCGNELTAVKSAAFRPGCPV